MSHLDRVLKSKNNFNQKQITYILGVARITVWRWEKEGMPFKRVKGVKIYELDRIANWLSKNPKHYETLVSLMIKGYVDSDKINLV